VEVERDLAKPPAMNPEKAAVAAKDGR